MKPARLIVVVLALVAFPALSLACLWDYDTLKQERARFPGTLELITGKFLRHSPEFYEWRIQDRLKKLNYDPNNVALYDDLAVAYQKTGQHARAVETMKRKEEIKPGLYETYSNLGTFYILNGELEKGLPYIDKALAINSDAHFGREKYQKWLVEYAIDRREDGKLSLPIGKHYHGGFRTHLLKCLNRANLTLSETQEAVKAILGMMRFANHDNPLLLEALGDLLRDGQDDSKRLAARAYLKAAEVQSTEAARTDYRLFATIALNGQTPTKEVIRAMTLPEIERDFITEQLNADGWYADLRAKELSWIEAGLNADAEFDQLYQREPSVISMRSSGDDETALSVWPVLAMLIGLPVALLLFIGFLLLLRYRVHETRG